MLVTILLKCGIPYKAERILKPGVGGGTRVGFGWVCAAQVSKRRTRFSKDLQSK